MEPTIEVPLKRTLLKKNFMIGIAPLEKEIQPLRDELTNHRVYGLLAEMDDVRLFMQKHVYPVWILCRF